MTRPYAFSFHFINSSTLFQVHQPPLFFSFSLTLPHFIIMSYIPFQAVLFVINALFGLSFLVGYKTRVSNFLCWLMMTSLHNRNPYILNAGISSPLSSPSPLSEFIKTSGDDMLRLFVFWGMFLPLGKCVSVDSIHNTKTSKYESPYVSPSPSPSPSPSHSPFPSPSLSS